MADHGPMFGYHRFEDVMAYEDNNPLLFISLPRGLRDNETFTSALRANSRSLVSQYDIYATLIQIADILGAQIPEDITLHGQSLLQKVPSDRTCHSLGISPVYCLCRFEETPLPSEDPLHSEIVNQVILTDLNRTIFGSQNLCQNHELDPNFVPEITRVWIPNTHDFGVYKLTFQTIYSEDVARWWTSVYVDLERSEIRLIEIWHRLDPYAKKKVREKAVPCLLNDAKEEMMRP